MSFPAASDPTAPAAAPATLSRRRFLRGAACLAAGTFLYTWRIEPHWVDVVRRSLPIEGLPPALAGKRLVQLSDLHAGPVVDQSFLVSAAESVAALQPDLLVMTGDFMSCEFDEQVGRALDVMRALPAAPLGRFAIPGNHDYGRHWKQRQVVGMLADGMEQLGVRMLRNEVAEASGLQVLGVDDMWGGNYRPAEALDRLDASRPAIALCHNPDAADDPAWRDYRGWILAGHTHGGQCKAPFFRPPLLPVRNKRYVAGEYVLSAGRQMYINRGLGYLRRVRFLCRPEITLFTLERAGA